jgi:transposase
VQAIVAVLSGQYHLSKRQIEELLADFFGVELGLGSVSALEQATSEVLKEPVAEAQAAVKEQPVANVDETGWREGKQRGWLWVAVTGVVTVFLIRLSRGAKVAKELLGETSGGVVGSDRWSGYNWVDSERRQVCWAHLLRDFEAFVERGDASERIGRMLLNEAERSFHWWHQVRDGTLSRLEFQAKMQVVQARVGELLRQGTTCSHPKTAKTCQNLLEVEEALWTFVRVEGVEPTNNAAERAVRAGVLWRKDSFGTQTPNGSRFAERMMTVVASLRQQKRNVLAYLQEACSAAIRCEKAPSLLPNTSLVVSTNCVVP